MEDKIKKIYKVVTETPKLKDAFTGITEDQFRTALQDEKAQDALYDDLVAYDLVTKGDPNEFWTNKGLRQPKVATPPVSQPPAVSLAPPQRQSIEQQAAVRPVEPTQPQAVAPVAPTQTPQQPTNKEIGYVPPAAGMLGKIAANPFVQSAVNTVKGLFSSNTGIEGGKTIKADKSPLAGYEESQTAYRDADKQFRRLEEESKIKGAGSAYGEYDYGTHLKLAKELPTLKAGAEKSLLQAGPVIDKIVEEAYNKADKSKFMEYNPSTKKETVSLAKIQNLSRQIAKQAGLPETGYAQQRLTTQMKAYVEHKQIEPDVEKEVYKLLGNQTPADVSKKDFEGYIKANTKVEGLKKQADMAQNTVANQLSKEAKATASQFEGQYKSLIADLDKRSASDPEIAALQQSIVAENSTIAKQTHEKYQQMVNSGKMTVEQATAARDQEYAALNSPKRIEEQKAQINALAKKKYGPEYANAFQQYVNGLNASNTKFNRRYKREAGEIVDLVNAKINSELETAQKQYKANPQTVEKIKAAYQKAYGKVLKDKDLKEFETDKNLGFWNQLANSTISSFGAGVSGYATTFGLGKVAQLGDVISNNFHPSNVAVSKAGDWLDPIKAAHGTGDLLGRMIPSIAVGAATAAATRGTGAPLAARLMLTGFADMMAESADISGTIYKQVLDKTGSAVDAGNAARDSFEGNLYNYPAYVVGGLPFFANALKGVPGLKGVLGRTFTGAALELGSETFTEAAQGAQEKSIMAGQRLKDTFKELTIQHILDTELQMAPIAILGGAPHLFQGGRDAIEKNFADRAVKAYRAKEVLSTELNDENQAQYFAQLHNEKGAAFAKSMLGSLVIDGKITPEQNERLSSFIDNYDNWSPQAKKLGLNKAGAKVGGILFNDLQQAKASTDPQLIKEAQLAFDNFIKTGKAEMLEVGLTDGSTYYYKPADFSRMLENPEFQKLIQEGSVKLGVMSPDMNTEFLSEKINMVQNAPRIGPNEQAPQQPSETTYETVSPEELQAFRQGQIDPERAAAIADDVALIQSGQMDINSIDDANYRLMVESAMGVGQQEQQGGAIIPEQFQRPQITLSAPEITVSGSGNLFIPSLRKLGYTDEEISGMTMEQQQEIVSNRIEPARAADSSKVDVVKENAKQERLAEMNAELDREETPILPTNEQLLLADQAAQNMGTAVNQPLETGAAAVEVGKSGRPVVEVEGDQVVEEEKPLTKEQQITTLRKQEQAEYDAMSDPNDKAKRKEIYDRYDKLISPLLPSQKNVKSSEKAEAPQAGSVGGGGDVDLTTVEYKQRYPKTHEVVFVDPSKVLDRLTKDDPDYDVQNKKNQIGSRVQKAKDFILNYAKDKRWINPKTSVRSETIMAEFEPSIAQINNGKISFEDGRHRILAAKELGIGKVAIEVPKGQANQFKKDFEAVEQSLKEAPQAGSVGGVKEIQSLPITRVEGLGMGQNQAEGAYYSTEKTNRYATPENPAKPAKINITNPLVVTNDIGLVKRRTAILNNNKEAFEESDFEEYEVPDGEFSIDDLNDAGIAKLASLTTKALQKEGYDSIYFPESKDQEGEIVVFNKQTNEKLQEAGGKTRKAEGGQSAKQSSEPTEKKPRKRGRSINVQAAMNVQLPNNKEAAVMQTILENPLSEDILQSIFGGPDTQAKSGRKSIKGERSARISMLKKNGVKSVGKMAELAASKLAEWDGSPDAMPNDFSDGLEDLVIDTILNYNSKESIAKDLLAMANLEQQQFDEQWYAGQQNEDLVRESEGIVDALTDEEFVELLGLEDEGVAEFLDNWNEERAESEKSPEQKEAEKIVSEAKQKVSDAEKALKQASNAADQSLNVPLGEKTPLGLTVQRGNADAQRKVKEAETALELAKSDLGKAESQLDKLKGKKTSQLEIDTKASPLTPFQTKNKEGQAARAALKESVGPTEFKRLENIAKNGEKILRDLQSRQILKIDCP